MTAKERLKEQLFLDHLERKAWQPRWLLLTPFVIGGYLIGALLATTGLFQQAVIDPSGILTIIYTFGLSLFVGVGILLTCIPLWKADKRLYTRRMEKLKGEYQ